MKILVLSKYPPVEGGMSGSAVRFARELAERGHEIDIVTNSDEVEPGFRELLWGQDETELIGHRGRGVIRLHNTTPLEVGSYLPWSNPHVSKLFGLSLSVAEQQGCDVVFASYFEPFAVVAAFVCRALGKPLIVRHAGSDIGRLARHPDLLPTYKWMLREADVVLTSNSSSKASRDLAMLGVPPHRLQAQKAASLPKWFSDQGADLELKELTHALRSCSSLHLVPEANDAIHELNSKPLPDDLPIIGTYGKVGITKGSFALLNALEQLLERGCQFNFVTLAGGFAGTLKQYCDKILTSKHLRSTTWILPLIAPWRVSSFVRSCEAICFLENSFPIDFHMPRIPREVLASGVCLVCSAEAADKQSFAASLVDGKNYVRIDDPNNISELSSQLQRVIDHPDLRRSIARHGYFLSKVVERNLSSTDFIVDFLERGFCDQRKREHGRCVD